MKQVEAQRTGSTKATVKLIVGRTWVEIVACLPTMDLRDLKT